MENKRYAERLTPKNAALLLIDHQVGLFTGVRDIPVAELKHNVVALAKAAKVLGVPTIVTATSPEMWGPVIPSWYVQRTAKLKAPRQSPDNRRLQTNDPSLCTGDPLPSNSDSQITFLE